MSIVSQPILEKSFTLKIKVKEITVTLRKLTSITGLKTRLICSTAALFRKQIAHSVGNNCIIRERLEK